jgi:hypothetical protein
MEELICCVETENGLCIKNFDVVISLLIKATRKRFNLKLKSKRLKKKYVKKFFMEIIEDKIKELTKLKELNENIKV